MIEYRRYFKENKVVTLLSKTVKTYNWSLSIHTMCEESSCKESLVSLNNDDLLTFLGND